jgi:hypothetical protein
MVNDARCLSCASLTRISSRGHLDWLRGGYTESAQNCCLWGANVAEVSTIVAGDSMNATTRVTDRKTVISGVVTVPSRLLDEYDVETSKRVGWAPWG